VQEPSRLYFYDVAGRYAAAQQRLGSLPGGWGSLGFSQESFYPYWLYRQAGGRAPHPAQRPAPAADYFLTAPTDDDLSPGFTARYAPVDTVGEYRLFRRR